MSYLTQMIGLATHNFSPRRRASSSPSRSFAASSVRPPPAIGNFWVDLTRMLLYILGADLLVYGLLLVWQGVPQNFGAYTAAHTCRAARQVQTIAQGPVASQEAIKMLGTNGGGFFNANSAHPFENPTPLSNFLEISSIFVIGAGPHLHVRPHDSAHPGHGWAICAAMYILFAAGFAVVCWAEAQSQSADSRRARHGPNSRAARRKHGGQGGALRHRGVHSFRHHYHRRLLRRRQQHA